MIEQFSRHQHFRGFSPTTVTRRASTLEQFARFLEPSTLGEATRDDIEGFLGTKASAATRHAYRSDLRVFYRWAVDRGLVPADPAIRVEPVKVPKSLPRPIDADAATGLLDFGQLRVRRMVALAVFAGLRCHEIAQLRAEDVTPAMIVVRNGKGGKDRTVPVHPTLGRLLDSLPPGPVFTIAGRPVHAASVSRSIARHLARAGVAATAHQLRHTFGTELARTSHGDMVLTAALMGHASMSTTMGYVALAQGAGADVVPRMYGQAA